MNGSVEVPFERYKEEDARKALEHASFVLEKVREFLAKEFMMEV